MQHKRRRQSGYLVGQRGVQTRRGPVLTIRRWVVDTFGRRREWGGPLADFKINLDKAPSL